MNVKPKDGASEWVDPDDAAELTDQFFEHATYAEGGVPIPTPTKRGRPRSDKPTVPVKLRLDADVLEAWRSTGPGWQTRMKTVLGSVVGRK